MISGREKYEQYIERFAGTAGGRAGLRYTQEQVDFLFKARENDVSWENIAKIWNEQTGWPKKGRAALEQKYFRVKNFF